jgi:hypothetical protein
MAVEAVIFQQIVDINWDQAIYTASPNNTINVAQFAAKGSGTNIGIALTPKGTGYISAQVPNGAASGGNARGANACDLQTIRTAASQVASGEGSVTAGYGNTASGQYSVAMGDRNAASGYGSAAIGSACVASATCAVAFGSSCEAIGVGSVSFGSFAKSHRNSMFTVARQRFAASGDNQFMIFPTYVRTTNDTPTELWTSASDRHVLISNTINHLILIVTAAKSDGSAVARYMRQVCIKRVGASTSLVGTVDPIGVDVAAGTSLAITADDTNESLKIEVTGIAGETWRWNCQAIGSELGIGS